MIPLLVLLGVFAVCRVAGWIGIEFFSEWQHCLRIALATMFLLTSSAHWGGKRADLIRMVPRGFLRPDLWVTLTGIAEIAGAVGLLFPLTLKAASVGLTLLLLAVFPANARAAREHLSIGGREVPGLAVRALVQVIFIGAVIAAGWF
jgi:uncharacterized membrane protein